jgi:LacI family transcriptional regulator
MVDKLPTIKEIARELNISISTVSRALHNHPSIGLRTKTRVHELAKELQYEPNQTAIFFQQRKTFTVGVILPELSESFFSTAISGIEDYAQKNKYTVLMGQSHDSEVLESQLVDTMKTHRVDGLIVSIAKNTISYEHFELLKKCNIPVVFFDRIPKMDKIHYVACDMKAGTVLAVNFLLQKKHRIIGMINGPEKLLASQERTIGYQLAMQKNRLKYDPNLIVTSNLTTEDNIKAMEILLTAKRRPTAIVTFNDYVTLDAVEYCHRNKIEINKDLCFVSYSNLPISTYMVYPPLASVEQYPYQQGRKAMDILLELLHINKEEAKNTAHLKIVLDPKLVIHKGTEFNV